MLRNKKRRKHSVIAWASKLNLLKILSYSLFALFLVFLVSLLYMPKNQHLKEELKSPSTIVSPKQYEVETSMDKQISQKLLHKQLSEVKKVYKHDRNVEDQSQKELLNYFVDIRHQPVSQNESVTLSSDVQKIRDFLIKQGADSIAFVDVLSSQLLKNIYVEGVYPDSNISDLLNKKVDESHIPENYQFIIKKIMISFIKPNLVFDKIATKGKEDAVRRSFVNQTTVIKKGQPIVYKGDVLTPLNLEILTNTGLYRKGINWKGLLPLVIGIIGITILLERVLSEYYNLSNKSMFILFAIESVYVLAIYLFSIFDWLPPFMEGAYLIPVSFFTFLFSILIKEKIPIFVTVFNGVLMLLLFHYSSSAVVFMLIVSGLTTYFVNRLKSRRDFTLMGVLIGLLSALSVFVVEINASDIVVNAIAINMAVVFANSVISIILVAGTLPYLEDLFNVTTNLKLLDYSDLNHPLMKRLLNETPGTYYHSLVMASLAEAASVKIGANGLLARVMAYYHDIGKLEKPEYFIENQSEIPNPHDNTMPSLSALTILSHPKYGMELAKQYKLPSEFSCAIMEHHGTSLLVYFYYKMLRLTTHNVVDENQFRYNCDRPKSKESAIIMLADGVEASVRALDKPTPNKISSMVDKIIRAKLDDRQLDESDLTLSDMEKIKEVFISVMASQYHSRIKYPDQVKSNGND